MWIYDLINALSFRRAAKGPVYVPFEQRSSIGGPATFLKNLRAYFDKTGFVYAKSLTTAGAILFPISYDKRELDKFKKRGGIICQRLDGIYYPEKHGKEYQQRNEKIREIYSNIADHVIFQSEYSRAQCFKMFGEIPTSSYSIIVNGVNTGIFYPQDSRLFDRNHIRFCTTGNIRNADMLVPVIKALDMISDSFSFTFHVIGPIKDEQCAALMNRSYILHHEQCDMLEVAELLRQTDIFIYSHLNPPCPNSVLEAIASGLPIVGYNSGSMVELLSFSTELLADAGNKLFHQFEDFDPALLAAKLELAIENYSDFRTKCLEFSEKYSMDHCGANYANLLEKLLSQGE